MSKIISPIAIDMGAKNTGVYYAHYQQNSTFEEMNKQGQVLVYGNYTPLLADRTTKRHVRRGYQRKKLAKRLLSVILKEYFDFSADKHTQALGFLMNRRGFSFLEEEYSKEHLNKLPDEVWGKLSEEVKNLFNGKGNIANQLMKIASNDHNKITQIFEAIQNIEDYKKYQKTDKEIKSDLVYVDYIEKINKACKIIAQNRNITDELVVKGDNDKQKLSKTSNWIIERLNKENNLTLKINKESYQTDLTKEITSINYQKIQQKLPNFEEQRNTIKQQQIESNKSIWHQINFSEFKLNPKNEKDLEEITTKTHLHHFCYAVYKINNEIISGGRHRSKFFDEIKDDLENFAKNDFLNDVGLGFKIKNGKPTKEKVKNPKYLKEFILAINANEKLGIDKLHKLICHISNFELKPLRAYFNNEDYKNGDDLDNKNLSKIASRWFMKHWIVTEEKDNKDKVNSYEKLKKEWINHNDKNNIIDFWLNTEPKLTIPPYQAMLNRYPPKCQSLLLNIGYLGKHCPNWKEWLNKLNPDKEYQEKLESLQSGKGKRTTKNGKKTDGRLVGDEKIMARQLQFILDTVKKQDSYKLNEIWSIYHQWQKPKTQNKDELQEKLQETLQKSHLPSELKRSLTFDDFEIEDSFAHFLNKYYQTRRKARDGRYFLIQEKKEKYLTRGKLLTLCTHRPRQKTHQWQLDLAAVLGVSADILKDKISDQNPEDYFKNITGFVSNCEKAAKVQKDHRGELKLKIYHELTNKPKGTLAKLANKCDELKQALIKEIGIKEILADKQPNEFNQKIALVFKFAQIHNIVFKDRSGFSKTCPVCSTDNAFRMQESDSGIAKASRLSALSIRLIDGVVMRICDVIARKVAITKWNDIKDDLQNGNKITIPLILEQNRFEFEPSLKMIKTNAKKIDEIQEDRGNQYKGQIVSAYSGENLGKDGEIDHIIPRASKYGTMNDEANLIYISKGDNQNKGNDAKFLNDLHNNYKKEIFGNKSDEEIKQFIYQELDNGINSESFAFGKYLSFINLNEEQKKAFRHALFLQDNDLLKQKVINALQNRNRTIVNGTQRYLAQCIADKIHRIARKEKKETLIEFDYFEYSARWNDPKSTYNLRKEYGLTKPKKQLLYSHLIDAQLAFLLATEDHQNDGSMGIKFLDKQTIWGRKIDKETGEVLPNQFFSDADVGKDKLERVDLNPKDSNQKIIDIEKNNSNEKQDLSKIFKRSIFKQQAIGERYRPVIKFEGKWYLGYPMTIKGGIYSCDEYCQEITKKNDVKKIEGIINNEKYYQLTTDNEKIKIWTIKTIDKKYKQIDKDSHKYFSQLNPKYGNDEKEEVGEIKFILSKCRYYVAKDEVCNAPKVLGKPGTKKYPFYKNWVDFDNAWHEEIGDDYAVKSGEYDLLNSVIEKKWNDFCKKRFASPENQLRNRHQVKGKKYTMISLGTASGTVFRINRNNQNIYQALPLDAQIIGKDKSNFLIKHSKNLTLSSSTADNDLAKNIDIKEAVKLERFEIPADQFFKEKLEGVKVFLNNNSVDVEYFPLDKFKKYFSQEIGDNKSIEVLTEAKAKDNLKNNPKLLYAYKNKIDESIKYTTRDGRVINIKPNKQSVNFSLMFKNCEGIYNDSKE
ncbi:hypothetical protein CRYPA_1204 [uncultured Candidatus Thioglobus sp.]|nr:hypothetical protein CRYPA_1204 [uncultured Candidatus Thioglobus sp.]